MKVLHLGYNVASQISTAVKALRNIGVEARGMIPARSRTVIVSNDGLEVLSTPRAGHSPGVIGQDFLRCARVLRAISWADVLHWHFGATLLPRELDLKWAAWLRKPGVAEFWGSEIRIANVDEPLNPHHRYLPADYREQLTEARSRATQESFAAAGLECLISCASLAPFVQPDLFPGPHFLRQRIILSDYLPKPPDTGCQHPVIVHSPSNPRLKGTPEILRVIELLKKKLPFDFRLIENVRHAEALRMMSEADIIIDQLYLGSHGLAALEAMALAKPTVCYLSPIMQRAYPSTLPLINTSVESLAGVLTTLIANASLRHDTGLRSRAYVEEYHDAERLVPQLVEIYGQVIKNRWAGARIPVRECPASAKTDGKHLRIS